MKGNANQASNSGVPKSMMAGKNSKLPPVSAGGAKGTRGAGGVVGKVNAAAGVRARKAAASAN